MNHESDPLTRLLDELAVLPVPKLMVESTRLILGNQPGNQRMRQAVRGAYAAQKVLYYLDGLRSIDGQRVHQSRAIKELLEVKGQESFEAELNATARAGVQEVWGHLWITCVHSIGRLLPLAVKGAGSKLEAGHRSTFENYEPLRHFFEHSDQQIGNPQYSGDVHFESENAQAWRMRIGLRQDESGKTVIRNWKSKSDHIVDISSAAVQTIQAIVVSNWDAMRSQCLSNVRDRFKLDPLNVPSIDQIDWSPLTRASRPDDWGTRPST